jgi:hypothetical protein
VFDLELLVGELFGREAILAAMSRAFGNLLVEGVTWPIARHGVGL